MITKTISTGFSIGALVAFALCFSHSEAQWVSNENGDNEHGDKVMFQILPERSEYRPGETATIRLILINRASEPLHISLGGVGLCGKFSGYADLLLLDGEGRKVPMTGWDVTELQVPDNKVKEMLMNSGAWVTLGKGEIYGSEVSLTLPLKRGRYRLVAEVHPPSFPGRQAEILREEHIHVLQSKHSADPVTIRVK